MTLPSVEPPFQSQPQGISLDELAQAFAQVMGAEPRRPKEPRSPDAGPPGDAPPTAKAAAVEQSVEPAPALPLASPDDSCPINPRTIFEAMLFVGNRENRPLTLAQAAELMRNVAADEIPPLVDELNRRYDTEGAPYRVVGDGDGYRLALREEHNALRNRFYGRVREAKLSQAAIDVLALVAYQQPITAEKITSLRGKPSSHVLSQLVRRGLLRIERPEQRREAPHYQTTDRFLRLFHLESLADLPRSEDP
ncbi:MAG: SMC-Scp complex subunit ScpB [Thermoguttaceae bacterium]